MAIAFSCSCGKHLKARDEFAGRKIKCPGCQGILLIPVIAPAPVAVPAVTEPAPAPPPSDPILDAEPPMVPRAKPVAMKVPEAVIPLAKTPPTREETTRPFRPANHIQPLLNPWADRSLEQTATPWLGDDQERFNRSMESRRGSRLWLVLVALFVVIALTAALGVSYFVIQ
jgi:hypothetical protein